MDNNIWQKRTAASINQWLRCHADGFRIRSTGGDFTVYRRFMRDTTDPNRILVSGSLSECKTAIMGTIRNCNRRINTP